MMLLTPYSASGYEYQCNSLLTIHQQTADLKCLT